MRYPDTYKCDTMYITKFERNYKNELVYQFRNAFPKSMTAVPVSYGAADLLKVTVLFNFDRYIMIPKRATGVKKSTKEPATNEEVRTYADDTGRSFNDAQIILNGGFIETLIE